MPELEISCDCESYCLTDSMSIPRDFQTIYEIMQNCFEGIRDDEFQIVKLETSLDSNVLNVNCNDLMDSMKKYMKRKALSMYVVSLILKYEKCSYISEGISKDPVFAQKYSTLKRQNSDILALAMSNPVQQLKKEFMGFINAANLANNPLVSK